LGSLCSNILQTCPSHLNRKVNLSFHKALQVLYLILFSITLYHLLVQIFFGVPFFPRY
jgi:hypothetical protein